MLPVVAQFALVLLKRIAERCIFHFYFCSHLSFMHRKLRMLVVLLLLSFRVSGQLFPAEESRLNYVMVGFYDPEASSSGEQRVELAVGTIPNENLFQKNITYSIQSAGGHLTGLVPGFGKSYTWRVVSVGSNAKNIVGKLHHFSTAISPAFDSDHVRMRIVKDAAAKYQESYVFSDGARMLFDMKGRPIWFLPNIPGAVTDNSVIRDMKLTNRGTITLLSDDVPYEINYAGRILWRAPHNNVTTGDTIERYHHEFTRLSNGHYMVLGTETTQWEWKFRTRSDSSLFIAPEGARAGDGHKYEPITFGTVLEFDSSGKLVWWWKSSDYFRKHKEENPGTIRGFFDPHENSFFFDERTKVLYVSFKNINQLYNVRYSDKSIQAVLGVTNAYGATNMPMMPYPAGIRFCEQHSCKISQEGNVYLFNNNICHPTVPPTVLMMQEKGGALKPVWEYTYPLDLGGMPRQPVTKGGNVTELADKSLLVSFCNPYGNLFIVNRRKELEWDAMLERWNDQARRWDILDEYRASFVAGRKELEKLIWGVRRN